VTLYLLPHLNERLRPKLFRELRPGARIVSNAFDMGEWKADRLHTVPTTGGFSSSAYFWVMPADVAGRWTVSLDGGQSAGEKREYEVRFKQRFQHITEASAKTGKGTAAVTTARIAGDSLSFTLGDTLTAGGQRLRFAGRVQRDRITGTVSNGEAEVGFWSAVRTERGPRPELELTAAAGGRPKP
jgi:hypothetical protein